MKILHVITRLILGGAQQNTVISCAAQVAAGHEVHLAYGPIFGPEGSMIEEAKASGATLHEIPSMVRELAPVKDWRCHQALRKLVRELRPDIVHSHSSKAGILARGAAWKEQVKSDASMPRAITCEDLNQDSMERFDSELHAYLLRRPQVIHTVHGLPFHDEQSRLIHRLYVGLERWAAKRCHHLIAITPQMVEAFVAEKIAHADQFSVIPSGVDVASFAPRPEARDAVRARYGIPLDAKVVGHVGRLDPLKGHADLLDVLRDLGPDTWLLFVGDGFGRDAVAGHPQMALGCTVITGRVDLHAVPDHLAAMDVMALPSYQEGQSRTLVEALLCGTPVVAYAVGGIPDVVKDGQTGRLVAVGDRAGLAAALRAALDDPAAAAAMAQRGRVDVADRFSAQRMNRALLRLYERMMAGSGSSSD